MHEIEFDEVEYFNRVNGTDGRDAFDALKSSKKVKNAKKLYDEMIEKLGLFLEDSAAMEMALSEYTRCSYLINCPDETETFDSDTLTNARNKCEKRFQKKLSQLEQFAFYNIFLLKKRIHDLEGEKQGLQKEFDKEKKKTRKRPNDFKDAPKKPRSAYQIFKDEQKATGVEGDELQKAIDQYKSLTDDQKSKYHQIAKKHADSYSREIDKYVQNLDEDDREQFQSSKKAKLEINKPKVKTLFPDMPKKKGSFLWSYFCGDRQKKIEKEMKKRYGDELNHIEKLKYKAQIAKEMWDNLSESKKSALKEKHQNVMAEDEAIFDTWYKSLDDERQAMYDRATLMDSKKSVMPQWMKDEPPEPARNLGSYLRKMAEMQLEEGLEGAAKQAAIKKAIKEMRQNPDKCKKKYEKSLKRREEAHKEWQESLNDFQNELLDDYRKSKEVPHVTEKDREYFANVVKELRAMETDDDRCNHLTDPDMLPKIKRLYIQSIGQKTKSSRKDMEKKWTSMLNGNHCYQKLLEYVTKISIRTVPETAKSVKKTAWVKRMEKEFGPGHPAKPKAVFYRYQDQMRETEPGLSSTEISQKYKNLKKSELLEFHVQIENEMLLYKANVKTWIKSLEKEKRKEYAEKHMRKDDRENIHESDDVYDLQPKTPMVYDPQIEELENSS